MAEPSTDAAPGGVVTVRGLAPDLKTRLRVRAAHNARSMEAEARAILEAALSAPEEDPTDLAAFARGLFAPLGGVELDLPARDAAREPPEFGGQPLAEGPVAASPRRQKQPGLKAAPAGRGRRT